MWIQRRFSTQLVQASATFPVVALTGARQVGKSSLLKRSFPDHHYVSLDVPSVASAAEHDPTAFFARHPLPVLIDEVQYAPGLFRPLKALVDADRHAMGRIIVTGSQKFPMMQGLSDSLAGRCAILELEGLSAAELAATGVDVAGSLTRTIERGAFPELWRQPEQRAELFYGSYLATYIERDVRQLLNVGKLRDFERFLRACAVRSGQLLNKSDLARDVGISPSTAGEWLSVLVASNQLDLLEPWFANVGKRLVKSPKLYLRDTGLLCYLLGIGTGELDRSPYAGAIFETWVYGELRKTIAASGRPRPLYFYRDQENREVDFVVDRGGRLTLLECKLTESPSARDAAGLDAVASVLRRNANLEIERRVIVSRPVEDHRQGADGPDVVHAARLFERFEGVPE